MKLRSLYVGDQKTDIFLVSEKHAKLDGCEGAYHPPLASIYISDALCPSRFNSVLMHELEHAANDMSGVTAMVKHICKPEFAAVDWEERLTEARAPVWHRLLQDLGFRFPRGFNR